ncbi:MAG: hypothetical protein LBE57_02620 [Methanosarcinales archaeon]|jgi:hypothetical protein|nr:hypothetical protein [Methanosarcinales archaeon]
MGASSEIQNHPANTKRSKFYCLIAAAFILMSFCSPAAAESFIPVMGSDTLDYYIGYGEPEITASLRGNHEFRKGDAATLQIAVANSGVLERVVAREFVIAANLNSAMFEEYVEGGEGGAPLVTRTVSVIQLSDYLAFLGQSADMNRQNTLAQMEMQIEAGRVNAQSLNIKFASDSPYIEVDGSRDYSHLASLNSGSYSVVTVPIQVSPRAPAGEYIIHMTVDYKYPSNARMIKAGNGTDGFTTFLYSDSFVQEYTVVTQTIQIPIHVASGAVFEVGTVSEVISAGKTRAIAVTYTNIGDETAYNAEAKLSLMHPLSSSRNRALLGDLAPGESVVVQYPITAHSDAVERTYGINTDIRYFDENSRLRIAPSLKIDVEMVNPYTPFTFRNALIGILLLTLLSFVYDYVKKQKRKGGKEEDV